MTVVRRAVVVDTLANKASVEMVDGSKWSPGQ
jgi:hypothetical protein